MNCYFCQKETNKINNYYGCIHNHKKGTTHVRHFYSDKKLFEVIWTFKYKRCKYEMLYWFSSTPYAILYRAAGQRQAITTLRFIPNWTPENCREKMSKVLAFA